MWRFTVDTEPHPVFTTYSAGNFAEVAPERLSPMAWSLVGVPVERGLRRLVGRLLGGRPRWASGSHFVFVGYFSCAPFHNLSAFCYLARHIPGVEPELVTRSYFQGADVPKTPDVRQSVVDGLAVAARVVREMSRTRQRTRMLAEHVADVESRLATLPDLAYGHCRLLPEALRLLDDVWEAHYATTMGILPALSLQRAVGDRVVRYWDELEPWVNRPGELVWDSLADLAADGVATAEDLPVPATGFLTRAFYEVADDHEPWSRYAARAGGVGVAEPGARLVPADPWDMVPLARVAQMHRLTWLVQTALRYREATKSLAMRMLHTLRQILPTVCATRDLDTDCWPYLAVGELADPNVPTGELRRRAQQRRQECAAALDQPVDAATWDARDRMDGTVAQCGDGEPRGLGVCPGVVDGVVVTPGRGPVRHDGVPVVLVCERADVDIHQFLSQVDAVVTARGSALSHVAILLREYGIPSVVGHPLATRLRDGQRVRVDGTTGEVRIRD